MNDTTISDMYRFLTICVLEQRGVHTLSRYTDNIMSGNEEDIIFITKYIDLSLRRTNDEKIKKFLNEFRLMIIDKCVVSQTRDCQAIETGNHYAFLLFQTRNEHQLNSITFKSKFNHSYNKSPIGDNMISITYIRDIICDKNDKMDILNTKTKDNNNIFTYYTNNGDIRVYRTILYNYTYDLNNESEKNIIIGPPSLYQISKTYIPKSKKIPDACKLS